MPLNEADDDARLYREGIELFNAGEFFEAHEVWEDLWHNAAGQRKSFYQGLIQCAVTLEHVRRGNPRGVRSVWASAVPKFTGLPEVYLGIHVPRLLAAIRRTIQPVLELPAHRFAPGAERGQDLPVDLGAAPKIELEGDVFE
jgi:predicted metal-dependent hydrolase